MTYSAGTVDRYGNPTVTYGAPVSTAARVEQTDSKEVLGDRDTRQTWFRIFLPPTASVGALDRITYSGRTLEVDGAPVTYWDSSAPHHITVMAYEISD